MKSINKTFVAAGALLGLLAICAAPAPADIQHLDDVIIHFSLCVGNDCVNGESFGFDTVRLKENNTRLHFDDTSTSASFPRNDWRFIANDSSNGGASYMAIEDSTAGRQVFRIEAGAPANALYVDDGGRIGRRTSNPVVELHIVDGDSPTLRLEQDGSSGFTPQIWDVAGNEANFFVRDASSGSRLPFKIKPGAPTNALALKGDGDVGFGTDNPDRDIHVRKSTAGDTTILVENLGAQNTQVRVLNNQSQWDMRNNTVGQFLITTNGLTDAQFTIDDGTGDVTIANAAETGDLTVHGDINVASGGTKNFAAVDPEDPSRWIYFSALEGPEAGTYFRGTARVVDGVAVVELPGHFSKMTEAEGLTVQLTPVGGWHQLYVDELSPARLVIRDAQGADGVEFHFFVQGVRKGFADFQVERPAPQGP